MTATQTKVFSQVIPSERREYLEEKIATLNNKAKKLRMAPLVLAFGEETPVKENGEIWGFEVLATVTGEAPSIAGWSLVAVLEPIGCTNLVHTAPGQEVNIDRYKNASTFCEQCKIDRYRKEVFVLRNEAGKEKIVGRNCLQLFLGGASVESILFWASLLPLGKQVEDFGGGHSPVTANIVSALAFVNSAIRKYGWVSRVSRSNATAIDMASADMAWQYGLYPPSFVGRESRLTCNDHDVERAKRALEWIRNGGMTGNTSYAHNMNALCAEDRVTYKNFGYVASLLCCYSKALAKANERTEKVESNYVGTVGKREVFKLTLRKRIELNDIYRCSTICVMDDKDGNVFTWKASGYVLAGEEGKELSIKGTVKKHEEYKGVKQTVLSRCSVV